MNCIRDDRIEFVLHEQASGGDHRTFETEINHDQ